MTTPRQSPLKWLGGRRFILTVGCGLVTTVLTYAEKVDGSIYAAVIIATVGAYITGDAYEHKVNVAAEHKE